MNKSGFPTWLIIVALWAFFVLQGIWGSIKDVQNIPYSQFLTYLDQDKVQSVTITEHQIQGQLKSGGGISSRSFVTMRVDQPDLAKALERHKVEFTGATEDTLFKEILSWVVPACIFFGLWMFFISRMSDKDGVGGGLMSIGRSKARVYVEEQLKVSFADVAGVDEAKDELKEVVNFLKEPEQYRRLGGRMPKGVMLVGPPGTGKTLLARAVAGEAGVPFFSISGSEFVELFVGVGAARVRDLFEQAQKKAPCIVFIDELDALGKARSINPMAGAHDEKEQTLNQLLVELDGFDAMVGLVVLAATNRPEILDPALLRSGRFDRQVLVDRPDRIGRLEILNVHMKGVTIDEAVDKEQIAAATAGFTGADLANLVNEAALLTARRNGDKVGMGDFNEAIERTVAGLEKKNRILNPEERRRVAYHEMGHALLALSLPGADPVHKVSIIPRGTAALGYTMQRPVEDRFLMLRDELEDRLTVLLGGRAAEMIIFKQASTGAADDLAKATDLARNMVTRFGMSNNGLGLMTYEHEPNTFLQKNYMTSFEQRLYSEETAHEIDKEVRTMVGLAYKRALSMLRVRKSLLESAAHQLLQQETLTQEELKNLMDTCPIPSRFDQNQRPATDIVPIDNPDRRAV